jgi:hypothetical protein
LLTPNILRDTNVLSIKHPLEQERFQQLVNLQTLYLLSIYRWRKLDCRRTGRSEVQRSLPCWMTDTVHLVFLY